MPSSDSVNLGSNPSPPAIANAGISGISRPSAELEQSEITEQKRTIGRTEVGTAPDTRQATFALMKSWIERQQANGWQSPEVKTAAERVLCGLDGCTRSDPPHHSIKTALWEDTEALRRAREAARRG